jgi:hypothetical protein
MHGLLQFLKVKNNLDQHCVIVFCDIQNQANFSKNLATLAEFTQEKHFFF